MVLVVSRSRAAQRAGRAPQAFFPELQHLKVKPALPGRSGSSSHAHVSKNSWRGALLCMPILWIFCRGDGRGPSIGTTIRLLFLCGGPSLVIGEQAAQSACMPW